MENQASPQVRHFPRGGRASQPVAQMGHYLPRMAVGIGALGAVKPETAQAVACRARRLEEPLPAHLADDADMPGRAGKEFPEGRLKAAAADLQTVASQDEVVARGVRERQVLPRTGIHPPGGQTPAPAFLPQQALHAPAGLQGGHPAAPRLQRQGQHPVSRPHIQHPPARTHPRQQKAQDGPVVVIVGQPQAVPADLALPVGQVPNMCRKRLRPRDPEGGTGQVTCHVRVQGNRKPHQEKKP